MSHRGSQLTSQGFTPSSLENRGATAIGGGGPSYTVASNTLLAAQRNLTVSCVNGQKPIERSRLLYFTDPANVSRAAQSLFKARWHRFFALDSRFFVGLVLGVEGCLISI